MHVIVQGLVQGVGFRYFALRQARAAGLAGYVRNLADGSVETEAQGSEEALKDFLSALRHGPQFAQVSRATVTWIDRDLQYPEFTIR